MPAARRRRRRRRTSAPKAAGPGAARAARAEPGAAASGWPARAARATARTAAPPAPPVGAGAVGVASSARRWARRRAMAAGAAARRRAALRAAASASVAVARAAPSRPRAPICATVVAASAGRVSRARPGSPRTPGIGNRLSENRGSGILDTYTYQANAASPQGDTPLLKTITLASGAGTKYFQYDLASNVLLEAAPTSHLDFQPDAAGKLSRMTEETQRTNSTLLYDGRGFLASARNAVTACGPLVTTPTYGSDGLLYHRQQQGLFTKAIQAQTRIFYFAGRPVAQLDGPPATGTLTFLTVDHLGTPILASTNTGVATWSGGFEPFGRDFTIPSAQQSGFFLRLPGQWDDASWDNSKLTSGLYYNLNRWYEHDTGRYTTPDLFLFAFTVGGQQAYAYVRANPLRLTDPAVLYGTSDCSYYDTRCAQCGGTYYCKTAPFWCNSFAKPPQPAKHGLHDFEGWPRCTRQCLQDCDAVSFGLRKAKPGCCFRGLASWRRSCYARLLASCR